MLTLVLGIVGLGIILKWMGYLTFTEGGNSPLHIQFTLFGYGITVKKPEQP